MAVITNVSNDKSDLLENQSILKSIFKTVDTLKDDLSECITFSNNPNSYNLTVQDQKVSVVYDAKKKVISRNINGGSYKTLINNVTDFYLKFFPESKSLLYRIEVNHTEQIRGYIFLGKLQDNLHIKS